MSKTLVSGVLMAALVVLFAGTAVAVNKVCPSSGKCVGTQRADGLTGTDNVNKIFGLGGDDVVYAFDSDDRLVGADGDDFLRGDIGADALQGGNGLDSLIGSAGADRLLGDLSEDSNPSSDNVAGGFGNDLEYGGPGNDLMGNIVFGEDTVTDEGSDELYGEAGNDRFFTVDGERDVIDCGPGTEDTVYKEEKDLARRNCENVYVKQQGMSSLASGSFPTAGEANPASIRDGAQAIE